jgi:hypothetical protein
VCTTGDRAPMDQLEWTKKNFFIFPVAVKNSIKCRSFDFLVTDVCNHGEHYETPCIETRITIIVDRYLVSG